MPDDAAPRGNAHRFTAIALLALACLAALAALSPPAAAGAPPVAIFTAPPNNATYSAGDLIVFMANDSFDPDGGPLYYIWTFPADTIEGPGAVVVNYTNFTVPGNYTVVLTVRDNESLESNASRQVRIGPANLPPTAVVASPANGSRFFTTEFINFSGTGSFDPEGGALTYSWSESPTGQLGTGENLSIRRPAGDHTVTLHVTDDHGHEATADVLVHVEVNVPPRVDAAPAAPPAGFDGDAFTFLATYMEDNGESAAFVFLVLDESPHAMQWASGADPRAGQVYALTLALLAGRHSFYALASDGNLTNLSATVQGPDVWLNISLLSPDKFASLSLSVVPPHTFNLSLWPGALPADPPGLVPVSGAYRVNGTALNASNFTLTVAFSPNAQLNASTALLHRWLCCDGAGSGQATPEWVSLATRLDRAENAATVDGAPLELPEVFRVFARHAVAPPNAPPMLAISYGGEFYPNSTIVFDGQNSTDPENATLLLAWRFTGPNFDTGWLPGKTARIAFPTVGAYNISLRGDDGSGNLVTKDISLEVRERPVPTPNTMEEPAALAGLAMAVLLSAALATWWRGRRPKRRKTYDDLYGRLYKDRMTEETEYTELFEKYAAPAEGGAPPANDLADPARR